MQCFYFSEVHFLKESHWVSKACPRKFLPLFSFFWYYVSLCESFLSKPCRDRITYMDSLCQKMKSPAGQSVDLIHNIFPTSTLDSTQQKRKKRKSKWKPWTNKKRIILAVCSTGAIALHLSKLLFVCNFHTNVYTRLKISLNVIWVKCE